MKHTKYISMAVLALTMAAPLMFSGCKSSERNAAPVYSNPIEDEFTAAKDRVPTAQTLYAMARILVARNRDDKAAFVLTRVIEDYPEFLPAYSELAELQMRNDATGEAMVTLRSGLSINPDNPSMLNNLGVCAMVSEDYGLAATHFREAIEAAPNMARYQANLGVTLALMGDYDGAYEVMRGVLSDYDAHTNLATICMANGDEQRARDEQRLAEEARQ